jgi:hypothetical protein
MFLPAADADAGVRSVNIWPIEAQRVASAAAHLSCYTHQHQLQLAAPAPSCKLRSLPPKCATSRQHCPHLLTVLTQDTITMHLLAQIFTGPSAAIQLLTFPATPTITSSSSLLQPHPASFAPSHRKDPSSCPEQLKMRTTGLPPGAPLRTTVSADSSRMRARGPPNGAAATLLAGPAVGCGWSSDAMFAGQTGEGVV